MQAVNGYISKFFFIVLPTVDTRVASLMSSRWYLLKVTNNRIFSSKQNKHAFSEIYAIYILGLAERI